MLQRGFIAGWLLLAGLSARAAEPELKRFDFVEPHMGTQFSISLYAADEASAAAAAQAAFARVAQLDGVMSDYKQTSELMQLCRSAGGDPVRVGDDLFHILAVSQELSRRTDGAFDVTVGPLSRLWRRARRQRKLPDPQRLAAARELVGHDKLLLDEQARTVQLLKPGMRLDLGAIGKGYAADEALAVLTRHGIRSALVAGSGDIAVSDAPPGAQGWNIGVAPLDDPQKPPSRFLSLKFAGVSTSGDAEQHVEIGGKRYSHVVDPRTGLGLTGRSSVTVVASNATTSDGLDTAACVLGPRKGLELIESSPGAAALIVRASDQGAETVESSRWRGLPAGEPNASVTDRP